MLAFPSHRSSARQADELDAHAHLFLLPIPPPGVVHFSFALLHIL